MKHFFFFFFLSIQLNLFAQEDTNESFTVPRAEVKGDLNNDKLEDKVVVTQDTISDTAPFRMQIFFAEPSGRYKLIYSSTTIIDAEYPGGIEGYRESGGSEDPLIQKGILYLKYQTLHGHIEHKFRFQNASFELIGFTQSDQTSEESYNIDFNLSTGKYVSTVWQAENDKTTIKKKKKYIKPLPKLQDINDLSDYIY